MKLTDLNPRTAPFFRPDELLVPYKDVERLFSDANALIAGDISALEISIQLNRALRKLERANAQFADVRSAVASLTESLDAECRSHAIALEENLRNFSTRITEALK